MGTLRYQVHRSTPAPLFFVAGGCSMYLGAALAVELFQQLSPAGVAWLRMLVAALALLAWRRPDRAAWRARRLILAGCFGLVTGLMNVTFTRRSLACCWVQRSLWSSAGRWSWPRWACGQSATLPR